MASLASLLSLLLLPVPCASLVRQPQSLPLSARATSTALTGLAAHPWPLKNGDILRTGWGSSSAFGPRNLSQATWVFESGIPQDAFYQSPLIDHDQNAIFSSTHRTLYSMAPSGKLNWATTLSQEDRPAGQLPTPVLYGDAIYMVDGQGCIVCLSLATGKERWRNRYAFGSGSDSWSMGIDPSSSTLFSVAYPDEASSSACFYGGTHFYANSLADGHEKWRYKLKACACNVMPAVFNGTVIFSDQIGNVYSLDVATGIERWFQPGNDDTTFTTAAAAIGENDMIYVPSNRGSHAGVLRAYSLATGEQRWSQTFDREANSGPAVYRDQNGKLRVSLGIANNGGLSLLPVLDIGAEFVGSVFSFDAETGEQAWEFNPPVWKHQACAGSTLSEQCLPDSFSNPSVDANGMLYIGWMGGTVFAINGTSGEEVSQYSIQSGIQGAPGIGKGMLVASSCRRVVGIRGLP